MFLNVHAFEVPGCLVKRSIRLAFSVLLLLLLCGMMMFVVCAGD